jgi:hypothetical protein
MRINSAGNIGIGTSAPAYKLDVQGSLGVSIGMTTGTIVATTSVSSGQLNATNATVTNVVATNMTAGAFAVEQFVATNITASNILVNTKVSSASLYAPLATISNLVSTASSTGTFNVSFVSAGSVFVNTQFSSANVYAPSANITNIVANATSTGSIDATGMTVGTILATTQISTGNVFSPSGTISNFVSTNITSSSIIANTIDITPSLGDISKEVLFSAVNNQTPEANVTGLAFDNTIVRSFTAYLSVSVLSANGNLYANYNIRGVQKDTGDWAVNTTFVGDNTGVVFTINNVNSKGQIQYTSTNIANWTSTKIKFRAHTTSV